MSDYKLVISGTIGAGKSTMLDKIADYIRMKELKVGVVREYIDSHPEGSAKLSSWITGKISLKEFEDYIFDCQTIDNEKVKDFPIIVYERTPIECAKVFCESSYCYKHVFDQALELHEMYNIPKPTKDNVTRIDANVSLEEVLDKIKMIVDMDLETNTKERIIYLMIDIETSMRRIKERGRLDELSYSDGYLENLIDAYEEFFTFDNQLEVIPEESSIDDKQDDSPENENSFPESQPKEYPSSTYTR